MYELRIRWDVNEKDAVDIWHQIINFECWGE